MGSAGKNKKIKMQLEEAKEHLWANFTKGHSAHLWTVHTETRNMTARLWFSVVNLSLKHAHGIFQTFSLKLRANTYFAIEMSLNKA